ncbi:sulfite exporter TauE/SafE family protein [Candidatus Micrarchaeota archaeon]|nr:sulfite exporter TauE/SafE family protein [Candidatus Micrarchaeota archaeon]MBU1887281.1 sulfite exporter TauE/SafE family protein [Candidatus Micrarchaeota archaeon]
MDIMQFLEQIGTSDIAIIAAFFIGLMTAISPCPLATNMTAIAYVSRKIEHSKNTILVGIVYAIGRAFAYAFLACLIVYAGINMQGISFFLQQYGEKLLGPLLILISMIMLELVKPTFALGGSKIASLQEKVAEKGYLGAFLLGVLFALTFCPFSAVLYFGMLIPLALKTGDAIVLPSVFGIATGLPVIFGSVILVKSVSKLGQIIGKVQKFEKGMRFFVGLVFLLVGIYYLFTRTIMS